MTTTDNIRWMIRADMPQVLAIEQEAFVCPWEEADFIRVLRMRTCIGMVAVAAEEVVGYMIYELYKSRLDLLNLAVREDCRRTGVGSLMLSKLKGKLSAARRTAITTLVSERNTGAHLWLRHNGFKCVKVERDAFDNWTSDDGYWFRFDH